MIELSGVSFSYGSPADGPVVLSGIDFALAPGECVAVLGANGSGKSTLVRLCDGLLTPDEGSVLVDGVDTRDGERVWDVRSRVALVMQNPDNQIVGTSVEEDCAFGPENLGLPRDEIRRRVDEALAAVGLAGMERREPHLLSEGQKQRLAIAGALAMRPAYVLLDEPTAMLDPDGRAAVLAAVDGLRATGHGVLHVTHQVADAATADRVLVLAEGGTAYLGTPEGLLGDPDRLARCGLELPPAGVLASELRARGFAVPITAMDAASIVETLCR
ncbi:MAG: energy-coupling factor transporter ATPase [Coriobacteriaceae bacterium]|nr:energy-coupling factor transporter ATPase [Coriobacteriaceae bacterium]